MNEADKSWKRPILASFYTSGFEAHSDTDRSEGSQVRVEHEMEVSGESDESDSSESVGDSDVIEVQLDNAHGGPNRHSGKIKLSQFVTDFSMKNPYYDNLISSFQKQVDGSSQRLGLSTVLF